MPTFAPGQLVRRLATVNAGDGELVRRFVESRCDEAFEELVRRHGSVVYGVCRRTLRDHHLAEDAFQAAFVVLARKAHTIHPPSAVGGWLYGVARKAALEASRAVRRRKHRETLPGTLPEYPIEISGPDDSAALVDAAITDLPEILRSAVLLYEIEGMSRTQATERLGIAEGTLSSRLAKARKALAKRLHRRGVVLPTALGASFTVPSTLVRAAIQSAQGTAPRMVQKLSHGVLRAMSFTKLKLTLAAMCALLVVVGFGLLRTTPTIAAPVPKVAEPPREGVIVISSFSDDKPLEVVKPDGTSLLVIKPKDRFQLMNPRLSPDGKQAVCVDRGTVIKRDPGVIVWNKFSMRLLDLKAQPAGSKTIAEDVYLQSLVWSADGRLIYFSHLDPDKLAESEKAGEMISFQTWVYNVADGTTTKRLKLPPEHKVVDVSPDGSTLLTSTNTAVSNHQTVHLISSDTLAPDKDSEIASGFLYAGRFSPDGKRLLMSGMFGKQGAVGEWEVVVRDLSTKKSKRLDLPKEMLQNSTTRLCWSPDGKRIAFQWEETIPRPAGEQEPPSIPGAPGGRRWTASRVTVCDADGANAKVIVRREYGEAITGLDWR